MVSVAILGFGVVGAGVAEILAKPGIACKLDDGLTLKYILDVRDFPDSPFAAHFVRDFSVIEADPDISIVVETIGGTGAALDFTRRALMAGKSVVTSNKELVATHGCALLQLAKQHEVSYLFEASVGGGIPIIRPLSQCLAANDITEICGILNGTTNYILTQMLQTELAFDEALARAQQNGYAERDPAADVEGDDACRKICILSDIAFGRDIDPAQVSTEGITGVTLADLTYADAAGKKIKLLGRAFRLPDGRVCAYVAPHLIAGRHPLAGVDDVFNAITVQGDAIGEVMFYGRGAGKMPTASAVMADVLDAAKQTNGRRYLTWLPGDGDGVAPPDGLVCPWYVRVNASVDAIRAAFGTVSLLARPGAPAKEVAFLTAPMTRAQLNAALAGHAPMSVIRVLERIE